MEPSFFNRELSWIEFNYRVLEEALDSDTPLLERVKFLAIFSSNLDEFFMVRIAGLVSQITSGYQGKGPSGYNAAEILDRLKERISELLSLQYKCFNDEILPSLKTHGIELYKSDNIPREYIDTLKDLFLNKYFLILTPMAVDQAHPFPFLSGKSLNLLVKIYDTHKDLPLYAVIPIPQRTRLISIPGDVTKTKFIYIEELIKLFVSHLFKGYEVVKTCTFRITRDADFLLDEEDAVDLLSAIESGLRQRDKGAPIRLEVESTTDDELLDFLSENIKSPEGFEYKIDGPIDLTSFFKIAGIPGFENLKDQPVKPIIQDYLLKSKKNIFDLINQKDILLHHPYESFDPVIKFIEEAATDPKVLAIKQTLYRTSGDSPIIKSLKKAASNGKQVTVLVELKARFDEAQNITWAKQLEQEGCHVVYGLVGLKTHSKVCLVVREEEDGIKRYIHLSTGNYNDKTAKLYTDIGLLTSRKSYGRDASAIFNLLTGYSEPPRWKKLVTAPLDLRNYFLDKIEIEKQNALQGNKAKILAKMNALIDIKIIEALYDASNSGVEIELIIRGMCRLIPGVKGMSENIKVYSIVDMLLEHSRIFYFYNGGEEDISLASADWMERNFDRRVEILFPIEDNSLKKEILDTINLTLQDNTKKRILQSDGRYLHCKNKQSPKKRSQTEIYEYYKRKNKHNINTNKILFIPRSNPDEKN